MNGFTVETETDQEIQDELQGLIDNWDGDGRVFRDCKWNYSTLYAMVTDEHSELQAQLTQLTAL